MKNINELKSERNDLSVELKEFQEVKEITDEIRTRIDEIADEVKVLDADVLRMELIEKTNKLEVERSEEIETDESEEEAPKPIGERFRDWLKEAVESRGKSSFMLEAERADPILTSTDTGMINKTVAPGIDVLTSPAEAFLRQIGVTFYPGLVGNFTVPSMAEDTASFVSEDASIQNASMTPASLTLAARRVTHTQVVTKETLAQTNPGVYSSIVENLVNGVWNAITNDVFDTLESDGASQEYTQKEENEFNFGDLVNMEASIGALNIGAGAYVTTPAVKSYLKQKIALGTTVGPAIWSTDNEVNGYKAFGVPAANFETVYFGDFSKCAVGQWGGYEIIVDPYTKANLGRIILTIVALADTGVTNKRGLTFANDVSANIF